MTADRLLNENKPDSANMIIQPIHLENPDLIEPLLLYKAKIADAANLTKMGYDSMVVHYSKKPSGNLQRAMVFYGTKLGLTNDEIRRQVDRRRDSTSYIATNFSLYNYRTLKSVSLSDYLGKVILLTYWYPGCGPCRAEFPFFEKAIKKFSGKDVVYLGINTSESQSGFVLPFLKTTGHSFIPLLDSPNRNKGTLPSPYEPANYLINQKGKIVFKDFQISDQNEETLVLMISELLKEGLQFENMTSLDSAKMK
ncbi:TlpA disulfide reductase family protein [Mucilaginibacter aquaedulcis]|uniref:TlpA disulfide reductase family protein n=1 Tax=Mucilaginibacter aquaedulcis TaxID=1187081 RepID=UPI0025B53CB0|nr:TlpA disulfide reductase family protein [Mucilaginibacter aquaedulcis]MDN3551238.1 TlpA disulfide reductase family protein [Mucilaginibacter aquaedulcis]